MGWDSVFGFGAVVRVWALIFERDDILSLLGVGFSIGGSDGGVVM